MNELQPSQPYLIQARAAHFCPRCAEPLKSVFRPPDNTSRWLLGVIAAILTPFLIGIFLWIAYSRQAKHEQSLTWWHCESCGWRAALEPQLERWQVWARLVFLAILLVIAFYVLWGVLSTSQPKALEATATASPTAAPTVQKAEPRKATRGQRR